MINFEIRVIFHLAELPVHVSEMTDGQVSNQPVPFMKQESWVVCLHLYWGLAIYKQVDIVQNDTYLRYNQLPCIRIGLGVCCPVLRDIKVVID